MRTKVFPTMKRFHCSFAPLWHFLPVIRVVFSKTQPVFSSEGNLACGPHPRPQAGTSSELWIETTYCTTCHNPHCENWAVWVLDVAKYRCSSEGFRRPWEKAPFASCAARLMPPPGAKQPGTEGCSILLVSFFLEDSSRYQHHSTEGGV